MASNTLKMSLFKLLIFLIFMTLSCADEFYTLYSGVMEKVYISQHHQHFIQRVCMMLANMNMYRV